MELLQDLIQCGGLALIGAVLFLMTVGFARLERRV